MKPYEIAACVLIVAHTDVFDVVAVVQDDVHAQRDGGNSSVVVGARRCDSGSMGKHDKGCGDDDDSIRKAMHYAKYLLSVCGRKVGKGGRGGRELVSVRWR